MIRIPEHPKLFCNTCERESTHLSLEYGRINIKSSKNNGTYQTYDVLQCRECSNITFMLSNWIHPGSMMGDPYKTDIIYHPPRSFRSKPNWYKRLDKKFRAVLDEVYIALDNALLLIASTGTRTAIDKLIEDKIGNAGTFQQKIETLEKKNIVNNEEKKLLLTVIDAGSASAHRGFRPNKKLINHIMEITESIFYKVCIEPNERKDLLKKAEKIQNKTPKRKKA
jgi:hypothetical protein